MSVAVLCPTRDNTAGAERAYRSLLATSTEADMILCVDGDQLDLYGHRMGGDRLRLFSKPRTSIVDLLNAAAEKYRGYDVYGLIVDDSVFVTRGWDTQVQGWVTGFKGGIGVVSAHHAAGPWVNFPYVSRRWIDTLGWYACPETHHFCWDTVSELLGDATSIVYAHEDEFSIHHDGLIQCSREAVMVHDTREFLDWCIDRRRWNIMKLREARDTAPSWAGACS